MISIITILIVLACLVLAFFVLIQSPKGGGLAGNFGSLSTQVMGVKQSTDVMEKGTWGSIAAIAILCIMLVSFVDKKGTPKMETAPKQQNSAPAAPANGANQPAAPATPAK